MSGWLVAVPVPFILIWAPSWTWIIVANVLLGISQGLTWSTTVVMKIDLVGPGRRGLAMGLNEAAGYAAVAGTALATGYVAESYGLRPGRSSWASPSRLSALGCRPWGSGRPATTHGSRPPVMWPAPTASTTTSTAS